HRSAQAGADAPLRANDPQLRSLHLLRDALSAARVGAGVRRMVHGRRTALVAGIGNDFRGDDGAGLEVARRIRALQRDDIEVRGIEGEEFGTAFGLSAAVAEAVNSIVEAIVHEIDAYLIGKE